MQVLSSKPTSSERSALDWVLSLLLSSEGIGVFVGADKSNLKFRKKCLLWIWDLCLIFWESSSWLAPFSSQVFFQERQGKAEAPDALRANSPSTSLQGFISTFRKAFYLFITSTLNKSVQVFLGYCVSRMVLRMVEIEHHQRNQAERPTDVEYVTEAYVRKHEAVEKSSCQSREHEAGKEQRECKFTRSRVIVR